ncbi:DUF1003 domain-containing protein [Sphingomonas turrisvirgatae]|uniref:DUF1003 domain-containing protein n=1 Tax=Sphingomonas turrisvirgatae TaxID=1888892 RepID=A0A1E3LS22_9SPHN|nr:DUF1003 domain-containing protein [Sphingomonas turrisvirgatae]ODP36539.1 hypothetical protein BFL28_05525 [Sphingomonas turrisvirgatae]
MAPQAPAQMADTLKQNIAALAERERIEQARAPLSERIARRITAFTGSMTFVVLHLVVYSLWIFINLGWLPIIPKFDPTFVVLAMEASVEAIFLSTFVLITQNRMAAAADRRAALDLHVNLLAEHELTKVAELVQRIAERLGVPADAPELREVTKDVEPTQVLDALDQRRREEGLDH